ncbi:MAG TPA: hemolysin family protein [Armatimonadota bacterium]|nr:hemolysin family protein [Armatimonadota bacterium]
MVQYDSTFWIFWVGVLIAGIGLAFVSLMETALVSVSRIRMHQLGEQGNTAAQLVERLTEHPQDFLGGFIVMINALVLLAANLTTVAARRYWGADSVVWANLVVLIILLLFCEITPKTISVYYAESMALRTARIAYIINTVLTPVVSVLNGISFALLWLLTRTRILHGHVHPAPTAFSEEDIKQLVSAGEQSGEVESTEREMIHGVIEFSDTTAHEIMVPRTDLVTLPADATLEEAIDMFMASGHSRIPMYEDNADNILGILYIKDLLIRLQTGKPVDRAQLALPTMVRPAYFVPETKKSDDLLREMQKKQVHMAIVVDEYGGTAGIITIEDLLEEIVGDIIDEYDQERAEVVMLPDGTADVSGRASLDKMHDTFDMEIPEDTEAETISGLVTEQLGRIPIANDVVTIAGIRLTVIEVKHNRIERLHAVALPSQESEQD